MMFDDLTLAVAGIVVGIAALAVGALAWSVRRISRA
jgi:hypothetical protein